MWGEGSEKEGLAEAMRLHTACLAVVRMEVRVVRVVREVREEVVVSVWMVDAWEVSVAEWVRVGETSIMIRRGELRPTSPNDYVGVGR